MIICGAELFKCEKEKRKILKSIFKEFGYGKVKINVDENIKIIDYHSFQRSTVNRALKN